MKMGFLEDLYMIIIKIYNNDEIFWGYINFRGFVKLFRFCFIGFKFVKKIFVWLEYLYTMVFRICYDDIFFLIDGDILRA